MAIHNISLTSENTELLKRLKKKLGLSCSAVVVTALRLLEKEEAKTPTGEGK